MKKLWYLLLLALAGSRTQAQECRFLPAECPVAGASDYGSPDDSVSRLGNPVLPLEIMMENHLRKEATGLVSRIAKKEGWDYVLLSEEASSGARDQNDQVLAYPLRPPHWILFHFELVVDPDSLKAWKDWLMDYSQRGLEGIKAYSQHQAGTQDQQQTYMDSANYYGQQKTKFMTDQMPQYQQALQTNNKSMISSYEKRMAVYDQKINAFIQKAAALQRDPASERAFQDRDSERKLQRIHFQDASVLVVEIGYNTDYVKSPDGVAAPAVSKDPMWMNTPSPDPVSVDLFNRSHNCVVLLKGDWRRSGSEGFTPAYRAAKVNTDKTTAKKTKCDQVQTISYQLSGNARAIRRWLTDMTQDK